MPEYLAPGVYVEETSFRSKSIEGVSTTTTGFIGPARYGPTELEPDIITSLGEFERTYGDRQQLQFSGEGPTHNFLWHAVRAFFEEGGRRLYVVRVFQRAGTDDGRAGAWLPTNPPASPAPTELASRVRVRARFPGLAGNLRVRFTLKLGQNILGSVPDPTQPGDIRRTVGPLLDHDVVWINDIASPPPSSPPAPIGDYYVAESYSHPITREITWRFTRALAGGLTSPPTTRELADLDPNPNPALSDKIRVVTLTVTVEPDEGSDLPSQVWDSLPLGPGHKRAGSPDSVFDKFAELPSSLQDARQLPIVIQGGSDIADGVKLLSALFDYQPSLKGAMNAPRSTDADRSADILLTGGDDGARPTPDQYAGTDNPDDPFKTGLKAFEDVEDISIVAAPGSTFGYEGGDEPRSRANTILTFLISHAERMRYRIAVLDSGNNQSIAQVRAMRARFDSKYAAFYYPWIRILDPVTQQEIYIPPSGSVAGIYARNDIERAVYKAPANEVVRVAIGFEQLLNKSQQDVLNPEGINCFRFFEGRGMRLWGARTISSDPEWKYVNLRRYFAYVERSIDKGTQWAVFEPNGDLLWGNVRRTIEDFLLNEWQMGALLGDKPEKAYFVRCDRSTMTQNDLDNGRLVCLIGIAPLRPAEYVIFRIGQWTADRKG